jgi:hypothetical protein
LLWTKSDDRSILIVPAVAAAAVEEAMKPRIAEMKTRLVLVAAVGLAVAGAGQAGAGVVDEAERWPTVKVLALPTALRGAGTPAAWGGAQRLQLMLQMGHTRDLTSVALSGDGKYLVTGSWDETAIL